MTKELERAGLPTAHVCSIVPISRTVGANRIVPAIAIPHPLGDPSRSAAEERGVRRRLLEKALAALEACHPRGPRNGAVHAMPLVCNIVYNPMVARRLHNVARYFQDC